MQTIRLQGIARPQEAKPAKDFKVGDFIKWNFGHLSEVLAIRPSGSKSFIFTIKEPGGVYERRFLGSRLLAVGQ